MEIRIQAQAGSEGRLFGSIGTADIARACSELGVEVERSEVRMPNGPIRMAGEHEVDFHLHAGIDVTLTVIVDSGDLGQVAEAYEPEDDETDEPDELD